MEETGIIRRFDDLGRINIPKEFRRRLFPLINEDFEVRHEKLSGK